MNFHLTRKSSNAKTGPIPVSTTSGSTCPPACPFNRDNEGGCYADSGPLAIHWKKVTAGERGVSLDEFCEQIERLPEGQLWRHNQAGDLPGIGDHIAPVALRKLVAANAGRRGFTYTHKPMNEHNQQLVRDANAQGFTVNVSTNSIAEVDEAMALKLPVVTILTKGDKVQMTEDGNRVVRCPAEYRDTNCAECGLCAVPDRSYAIGFTPHGSGKKRVLNYAESKSIEVAQ